MKNIKNYTSSVPASRSSAYIEDLLLDIGVNSIAKEFDKEKEVVGFTFCLEVSGQFCTFKLPCNVESVYAKLKQGKTMRTEVQITNLKEQAKRTAWKLLYDWVQIQVSMILMDQVKPAEVFLPYLFDWGKNETLFQSIEAGKFKNLLPQKAGGAE